MMSTCAAAAADREGALAAGTVRGMAGSSGYKIQYDPFSQEALDCRYARNDAARAGADLAFDARGLAACAERGDFGDACLGEFSRVQRAQSFFESAVNSVQFSCR